MSSSDGSDTHRSGSAAGNDTHRSGSSTVGRCRLTPG
jgi:hypothetical protein